MSDPLGGAIDRLAERGLDLTKKGPAQRDNGFVAQGDLHDAPVVRAGCAEDFGDRSADPAQLPIGIAVRDGVQIDRRSEEHTSELPSLMRISYAVFCLKKKTT